VAVTTKAIWKRDQLEVTFDVFDVLGLHEAG
jgi:hypothetical protein